ncbi:MAG TPA: MipA/OmpV family protein, partial [Chromatiales bacterium]|nr:MipA/OmpV family protein [Chromatiales bacterium]
GFAIGGENELGFAELSLFQDILGNSNGTKLRLELGKFIRSGRWTVVPSVLAIGLSGDFNDYYYGVRAGEASASRPVYSAGSGVNLAAQTYLMLDLGKRWHILGNIRADYLAPAITDSPIVDQDWMVSGMISLLYSFPFKARD